MKPDQIIELFSQATTKNSIRERELFLEEACRGQPELRAQLASLLEAHDAAGGFLKESSGWTPRVEDPVGEKPGTIIGRYRILKTIGEGGCGVVYLAEQAEPVRRRVALKVVKLGMDTRGVIARFAAERQALARMHHPGIAKVFDAGATDSGRPYFVMELVPGVRITDFCRENKLSTPERLELFMQVCQAIQHAHEKGIIHRDIKPSNILVTSRDRRPVPVVIDFGIAKATEEALAEKTRLTLTEPFLGTPAYMSPEQAEASAQDVDTRSDIYSLGALLYELLTDTAPFDAKTLLCSGLEQMRRVIRETEPERPSLRVERERIGAPGSGSDTGIATDLDWIVMKALEKDRARRFSSAAEFAADIARHCNHEPVLARPPTATYRLQKLVRKHQGAVLAAAALMMTMAVLGSLALWQGWRAQQEARRVRAQGILLAAAAAKDPLLQAQLLLELGDGPLPAKAASVAREALERPLPVAVFRGHEYTIKCMAVSPDGQRVVTGARDGTARLWRVDATEEPRVLRHPNGVWSAAFAPDGKLIVTGTGGAAANVGPTNAADQYCVCLWPVPGFGPPRYLRGHADNVRSVAFSRDGRRVVSASDDRTACVWAVNGTSPAIVLQGHDAAVRGAEFSPDGAAIVTASDDRTARVWRWAGGAEPIALRGHRGPVNSASFSPDGTRVVTASADHTVRIWWVDGRGEIVVLEGNTRENLEARYRGINWAGFTPDGQQILGTGRDGAAWAWSIDGPEKSDRLEGMGGEVSRVIFSPDGHYAAASVVGHASVAARGERPHRVATGHEQSISLMAFSPDNRRLFTASDDSIRVWQLDRKAGPVTLQAPNQIAGTDTALAFNAAGSCVIVGTEEGSVRVWSVEGRLSPVVLGGLTAPVLAVVESSGAGRILAISADGAIGQWNWAPGNMAAAPRIEKPVSLTPAQETPLQWASWSRDGARVLICTKNKALEIRPVNSAKPPMSLPAPARPFAPVGGAFSADGQHVAVADLDGSAVVWPNVGANTGARAPVVFRGHLDEVLSVAFGPDSQRIVSTSTDGTARVWRMTDGQELTVLRGRHGWVTSAAFNQDGTLVATAAGRSGPDLEEAIRLWPADGKGEVQILNAGSAVRQVLFSPDGAHLAAALRDGRTRLWPTAWPALRAQLQANVPAPLTPRERMEHLGESSGEARRNYAEAERRMGRRPQVIE
jgi:WD40 repeat protein/tRNA A-37 threonylcarbamoyl transferase component Bud32